jgi:hypothetical protein
MIVYDQRRPPLVMSDERTPVLPLQPDSDRLRAAPWLGTKAAFLVIIANGPHALHAQIEHAAQRCVQLPRGPLRSTPAADASR